MIAHLINHDLRLTIQGDKGTMESKIPGGHVKVLLNSLKMVVPCFSDYYEPTNDCRS